MDDSKEKPRIRIPAETRLVPDEEAATAKAQERVLNVDVGDESPTG